MGQTGTKRIDLAHPQAFLLRVNANPLAGGDTSGLAEPDPRCLLEGGSPGGFTRLRGCFDASGCCFHTFALVATCIFGAVEGGVGGIDQDGGVGTCDGTQAGDADAQCQVLGGA